MQRGDGRSSSLNACKSSNSLPSSVWRGAGLHGGVAMDIRKPPAKAKEARERGDGKDSLGTASKALSLNKTALGGEPGYIGCARCIRARRLLVWPVRLDYLVLRGRLAIAGGAISVMRPSSKAFPRSALKRSGSIGIIIIHPSQIVLICSASTSAGISSRILP